MNWEESDAEIRQLAQSIDYVPDIVIAIARGGWVPAVIIARQCKVKDLYSIKIRREGNERRIMSDTVPVVEGLKVLLVEDMLETGQSMLVGRDILKIKVQK